MTADPSIYEGVAHLFHDAYERLAPNHGYKTRDASAVPWKDVPEDNRALMIATVKAVLATGVVSAGGSAQDRIAVLEAAGDAMRDVARELYMAYSDPYGDSDMHDMYAEANTAWQVARDDR